jgi:hypothetical protein
MGLRFARKDTETWIFTQKLAPSARERKGREENE